MKILFILLAFSLYLFASIGNVGAVKGSATITRDTEDLHVTAGMELEEKDKITTQAKSKVQVILKDNTVVTIGQNTTFSFEEYFFDGSKKSKVNMQVNRGFFRSVTGEIGKVAPERFKVKTANATIGIRGTDFSGDVKPGRELFKCYKGAIYIDHNGVIKGLQSGMMMELYRGKMTVKKIGSPRFSGGAGGASGVRRGRADNSAIASATQQATQRVIDALPQTPPSPLPPSVNPPSGTSVDPFTISPQMDNRPTNY